MVLACLGAGAAEAQPTSRAQLERSESRLVGVPELERPLPMPVSVRSFDFRLRRWAQAQYLRYQRAFTQYQKLQAEDFSPGRQVRLSALYNQQFLLYRSLESIGGDAVLASDTPALSLMQNEGLTQARWQARVRALSAYLEQSGWIIWDYQSLSKRARLLPALDVNDLHVGSLPLVVIEHNEFAWKPHFESREAYLEAILSHLNWERVNLILTHRS